MQSTLSPRTTDDPCDNVGIVPDAVQVAPSDEELTSLLHQAARHRSASLAHVAPELTADPATRPLDATVRPAPKSDERRPEDGSARPTAPVVDVMNRPAPANDDLMFADGRSWTRHAVRAFIVLLLAACIGVTAAGWKSYGAVAAKIAAALAAQLVVGSSQPENPELAAQPAPPAQAAPAPVATAPAVPAAPDSTPLLQSMARDLAALGQEVEALKAGMEQLKASQQQMLHDVAKASELKASELKASEQKASEQNLRPKASTPPPRPAVAQTRKPVHSISPPQGPAASAALPQVAAPRYVPQQYYIPPPQPMAPPQAAAEPPIEADSSIPRPPMPVR